jgi:hypothetical protein
MSFYPDQRFVSDLIRLRRDVRLPDGALGGVVVSKGQAVEIRNKVARGIIPNRHIIIEAANELGLRDFSALKNLMLVKERTRILEKDPIAGKDPKRGKRVFAPKDGMVVFVGEGRIIFQEMPRVVELEAGVRGTVVDVVNEREVRIEAVGALVQGVWGNGRNVITTMRMEPSGGIEEMPRDELDTNYRNEIIISTHPITPEVLEVAEFRGFGGIVAPSMSAGLLDEALAWQGAILLTEGFGEMRMSPSTLELLKEFDNYQATLNASLVNRWEMRRPELVISRSSGDNIAVPGMFDGIKRGAIVRITREPYGGLIGKVLELPKKAMLLENGLRVMSAKVELTTTGQQFFVPLASIEFVS